MSSEDHSGKLLLLLETYTLILFAVLSFNPYLGGFGYYNYAILIFFVPQVITHAEYVSFEKTVKPMSLMDTAVYIIDMLEKHQLKLEKYKASLDSMTAQREVFKEFLLCKGDIKIWKREIST